MHKNHPEIAAIFPGIYSLRGIFDQDFDPAIKSKETGNTQVEFVSISDQFEIIFKQLIEEIFNVDIPFCQTTNDENCKNCSYRQICRR